MSDSPPRALALFTDRDDQRAAIDAHLERLRAGQGHTQGAVLSFFGVGGVGKTSLREKGLAEFRAKLDQDLYSIAPFALAELDLDTDSVRPEMPVAHFLGRVRTALRKSGISTPLFDYVYLMWWREEYPDQPITLRKHERGEGALAGLLDTADLIVNLAATVGLSLPSMATAQGLNRLFPKVYDWFQHSRAGTRFDGSPQSWSQRERTERMSALLALDLIDAISQRPQTTICLVIDGFERVQSRELRPDAQWALATFVAEVLHCPNTLPPPDGRPLRGRIGFIVFGREKLRWAEFYARERVRCDWRREITEHTELLGLTEDDARWFLIDKAAPWERDQRRLEVAELIERHVDGILLAACEHLPGRPPSYLPYYLDLAVDTIRNNVASFVPEMLGETPADLERRFLRSLDPKHLRALQALALALEFDREIFDFLRSRGETDGYDFAWLVGDHWSFVTPIGGRPDFHGFHRHMQISLIASLRTAENLLRAREILAAIIDRLFEQLHIERPTDFGSRHETALAEIMNLLREHVADGLLEGEAATRHALALEAQLAKIQAASLRQPFLDWTMQTAQQLLVPDHPDTLTTRSKLPARMQAASLRQPLLDWTMQTAQQLLVPDDPDTLTTRSNLAAWTGESGDPAAARDLFRALLPDYERVLGPDHPDTLTTRSNLAAWTGESGYPAAARDLFRALLPDYERVLGPDHSETLRTRNNIALFTGESGEPAAARDLFRALLPDQVRVFGPDHPDTLRTRNNIAGWTGNAGDLVAARDLYRALLPDYERVLGPDHPETLRTRNNIAGITGIAGDPAAARKLFVALLPDQVRVLGPDHPDTLRTRNNIALFTGESGDPAAARDLFRALLPDQVRVLGSDHPETLRTRNNFAAWTGNAGDPAAARDLFRALLPDQVRVLGSDHPETLRTRNNFAAWTGNAGDPAAARDLFRALLPDYERVLGPDHPETLRTRNNFAACTGTSGDPAAARELFRALLPDRERVLGPDHPDTLTTRNNFASWTGYAGEPAAARDLFRALLPDHVRVVGPDHPDTLTTRYNFAAWTGASGEPAVARNMFPALLPDFERVLGPDHPETRRVHSWLERLDTLVENKLGPAGCAVDLSPPSRNSPCPCGSGLPYKRCHGKTV